MNCQCCKERGTEAQHAWQPLGPGEKVTSFMTLGSHYRGFPVVKICGACKVRIETGQPVYFTVRKVTMICEDGKATQL